MGDFNSDHTVPEGTLDFLMKTIERPVSDTTPEEDFKRKIVQYMAEPLDILKKDRWIFNDFAGSTSCFGGNPDHFAIENASYKSAGRVLLCAKHESDHISNFWFEGPHVTDHHGLIVDILRGSM